MGVKIETVIEGKTVYIRERYAKQLERIYRKHDFSQVSIYREDNKVRVVAIE